MKLDPTHLKNGVYYLTEPLEYFESLYLEVRTKEQRVHPDEFVQALPNVPSDHPHILEWKKRAHTLSNFEHFLSKKRPKSVLDIGCGNGWMTSHVAKHCDRIIGLDVGAQELEQAARCHSMNHLSFVCCSDWNLLPEHQFDLIYFSGSFHYFEHNDAFWKALKRLLLPDGEIHILDTPFYNDQSVTSAKQRSKDYFQNIGTASAADYYHHAQWSDLPAHDVLYRPTIVNRILRNRSPFCWVRVQP